MPAAPSGRSTKAKITEWDMGRQDATMVHDLELGSDGKVYAVDMINDAILSLDPETYPNHVLHGAERDWIESRMRDISSGYADPAP